ncbi:MAG: hypothetical protein RBU45_06945 [Myxococcota bacterium]|jgi:hypothetical protein|nr:hypothetical protein [Myxococcota bacterium]
MGEHTLVLRIPDADDPTVGELWQRCQAAAAAFGGELAGWEPGDALVRGQAQQEKLRELRALLQHLEHPEAHQPALTGSGGAPHRSSTPTPSPSSVAGEVVSRGRALEWRPRSPDPPGDESEAEAKLLRLLASASAARRAPPAPAAPPEPGFPDTAPPRGRGPSPLPSLPQLLLNLGTCLQEQGLRVPEGFEERLLALLGSSGADS